MYKYINCMKNEIIFRLKITLLFHELEEYISITE